MNNGYYVYNNEALSCCVLLEVLSILGSVKCDRICLILPFLLDKNTIKELEKGGVEDKFLIKISNRYFNFNKRFLALLPVMINSILILIKLNKIYLKDDFIFCDEVLDIDGDYGQRFMSVKLVIPRFVEEFNKYTTKELYEFLGVEL